MRNGAHAFNVLNHPNFDQPVGNLGDPNFGYILRTVATPTRDRARLSLRRTDECVRPYVGRDGTSKAHLHKKGR